MMVLIVGLIIFLGVHLLPTSPEVSTGLKARLGDRTYKAIFGLLSLIGFVIIVLGYHKLQLHPGKNPVLWEPPVWTRHIAIALMLPAMIAIAAFIIPSRIGRAMKHPMLISIKTWALAHLLANGDLGALLLFGSFLAYAVYDRISLKKRATAPADFAPPPPAINDFLVIALGLALWAALLFGGHEWLIGKSPLA